MEHLDVDSVTQSDAGSRADRRALADPLGTTDLAVNYYRLPSGDGLPGGLHAHTDQEEVFVVLDGAATFETYGTVAAPGPGDEVTVGEGEAVRFAPGEFQSGRPAGDGCLDILAVGAPRDTTDVRLPVTCPDCGHGNVRLETGDGVAFTCPDCGVERMPKPCLDCGGDLEMHLADTADTVAVCTDCEAAFDAPPLGDRPE